MSKLPTILEMLQSGVHFGHRLSKQYPKMSPYIFGQKNGINIINLEKTQIKLEEAYKFVKELASNGGTILFLGTKKQAQSIIKEHANKCGMPYIDQRWLGGTFTNYDTISKVIKKYNELVDKQKKGELEKYTKKEQSKFKKEIEKLEILVHGVKDLKKVPDAVYIVDLKKEKTALREANKRGIPIVAICDANTNPEQVTYPIPGNDDATKAINLITGVMAQAVEEGKSQIKAQPAKVEVSKSKSKSSK
ncbi:30S ribosomal protein S2 [Patescibacteria group bacterium]|nr:30S ribosomal protein S2 [Patescibacteria group bacterium]